MLIRSGLQAGDSPARAPASVPTVPRKHTVTTSATTTTTLAKTSPSQPRFWTVQAGDTFGVISSKSGIPVATLERLNPKVKSTSLFIGERLRLR